MGVHYVYTTNKTIGQGQREAMKLSRENPDIEIILMNEVPEVVAIYLTENNVVPFLYRKKVNFESVPVNAV